MSVSDKRLEKKAETHEAILESAARLIRKQGLSAASVGRVMQGAGKTVGGFYAHFQSRHHLAAEALRRALSENIDLLTAGLEKATAREKYDQLVRRYLSRQHREMGERGCPLPATLSEIENADAVVAAAFREGIDELVERLTPLFEDREKLSARQRALGTLCTLIGAMALARATRGSPLSDEVLLAGRRLLFHLQGENG